MHPVQRWTLFDYRWIFRKQNLSIGIYSVDPVDPLDPLVPVDSVCTQSPAEIFFRRTFKHRLRVLVESRIPVEEQENGQQNNSETNGIYIYIHINIYTHIDVDPWTLPSQMQLILPRGMNRKIWHLSEHIYCA